MELLIFFAAIVALVWGIYLLPRWTPLSIATCYLIVASAYGYAMFNFKLGITMSLDRILLLGLVASFAWFWRTRRTVPREISSSETLLIGFLGLLVINTFAYEWNRSTPNQVPIIQHLIEGYVIPFILYWIARRSVLTQKSVDKVYLLFGIFGIYLAVTALFEIMGMWSLVFPREIGNPDVGIHFGRARGPFLQSVRLGDLPAHLSVHELDSARLSKSLGTKRRTAGICAVRTVLGRSPGDLYKKYLAGPRRCGNDCCTTDFPNATEKPVSACRSLCVDLGGRRQRKYRQHPT